MKEEKRVAIIGSVGVPANYGGFETLAEQLTRHLGSRFKFTVYCSSRQYDKKLSTFNNARLKYIPLYANGWQGIFYDIWSMLHAVRKNDTLLILGVTGVILLPFLRFFKAKTIVHIDGLEWRRDKWHPLAKKFLKFSERIAIRYADDIVVDNPALKDLISEVYPKRDYQLIAYGSETKNEGYEKHFANGLIPRKDYAMALCRIVPENNIRPILDAFKEDVSMHLVFVGNWQVNAYSRELYKSYSGVSNIDLRSPIYDPTKVEALRKRCKIYLHGHSAGGTNPSLVEAMRSRVPIIAKDVSFNRATMQSEGLFFSDKKDLAQKLNTLKLNELDSFAKKLEKVALEKYRWSHIAEEYSNIF